MRCPHCDEMLVLLLWCWNGAWHRTAWRWRDPLWMVRWGHYYLAVCRACGEPVS
jgi:hypothetical protein